MHNAKPTTRRSGFRLRIAVLGVLAPLGLAACGGDDATPTAEDTAAEEEESDATESGGEAADDALAEAADFYEGNTITLAVGSSPGGGYDTYMRMLAPYLEEALGATITVENRTGGGGLLMINNAVTDTEQDGSLLMIINGIGAAGSQLSGAEGVAYDVGELSHIGMVAQAVPVFTGLAGSDVTTLEDLATTDDLLFGATGIASSANVNAVSLIAAMGLDATVATNFEGSSEMELALLAGDLDAFSGSLDSRVPSYEAGETVPIMVVDDQPSEALPDAPIISALEPYYVEGGADIMRAHLAMTRFHRPLVTHPDVPPERLEYLRQVFAEVMQDPDLIAESEEIGRPLNYRSGEEVEQIVADVLAAPDAYVEVLQGAQE